MFTVRLLAKKRSALLTLLSFLAIHYASSRATTSSARSAYTTEPEASESLLKLQEWRDRPLKPFRAISYGNRPLSVSAPSFVRAVRELEPPTEVRPNERFPASDYGMENGSKGASQLETKPNELTDLLHPKDTIGNADSTSDALAVDEWSKAEQINELDEGSENHKSTMDISEDTRDDYAGLMVH